MQNISLVIGEQDYAGTQYVNEMVENAKQVFSIAEAAHFPFFEAPEQFRSVMEKIFAD